MNETKLGPLNPTMDQDRKNFGTIGIAINTLRKLFRRR